MIKLSPSILSADFMNFGNDIKILADNNVKYIHFDVMDGMFVPNISVGIPVIKSLRNFIDKKYSDYDMVIDAHLMVINPERYIDEFISAGCDIINFHFEATKNHSDIINKIKEFNKNNKNNKIIKIGMTINPDTDYTELLPYIKDLDLVLVMGVKPGFGGQSLIEECIEKVASLREYININKLTCELEIDGGIKLNNIDKVLEAGADVIVVGSDIFENPDFPDKVGAIKSYHKIFEDFLDNKNN